MTSPFSRLPDDQLLALCIDRESRGEPCPGRVAVGSVVFNRAAWGLAHKGWGKLYGNSIQSVILAPDQFSWTIGNKMDPNHLDALEIAQDFAGALKSRENEWLKSNFEIAQGLMSGEIPINTSALYYHARSVHPSWAKGKRIVLVIGNHIFYS